MALPSIQLESPADRKRRRDREWAQANAEKNRAKVRAWNRANTERHRAKSREYYKNNPDKVRAYRLANAESLKAKAAARRKANAAVENERNRQREARKLKACPVWARRDPRIRALYVVADWLRRRGDNVHVDHLFPLKPRDSNSPQGLHVYANLRIVDQQMNNSKYNHPPAQAEVTTQLVVLGVAS